jgi:hypothetical protein
MHGIHCIDNSDNTIYKIDTMHNIFYLFSICVFQILIVINIEKGKFNHKLGKAILLREQNKLQGRGK